MLGKLVNGEFIQASENEYSKVVVANPTEAQLKYLFGYKEVVVVVEPEYDNTTHHLEPVYTETATTITKDWNVVENVAEGVI